MHFIGIFNRDGGTFRTLDMEAFCANAQAIFAAEGHSLECQVVDGAEVVEALQAAARLGRDNVILAGGGDGTISSAAEIAYGSGVVLAVLPAGTMNLFARALGLPTNLDQALAAIATGQVQSVDIATANGRTFVHQFGVGVHARLVRIRETLTYSSRLGKMWASLKAVVAAMLRPPRFEIEVVTRRGVEKRFASGIAVSNNPVGEGHIPHADSLDQGVLGVYIAKPMSSLGLTWLAVCILFGKWKWHPEVSEKEVEQLTLRFPRRKRSSQAVLDGELIDLEGVVDLRIHPRSLKVIVPSPTN